MLLDAWKSFLFVAADNDKLLQKAPDSKAHAIILDLEDGVGGDRKAAARANVSGAITMIKTAGKGVVVRTNSNLLDISDDVRHAPLWQADAVMLPKVETAARLSAAGELLQERAGEAGNEETLPGLIALIETPAGLAGLQTIAAHPALIGLAFGTEDYCLGLGVEPALESLSIPCGLLAIHARANGLMALATPSSIANFSDLDRYREACRLGRHLGCTGALCIHPKQVECVNEVFEPSESEIHNARIIVQAWEDAQAKGRCVLSLNGRMIDKPVAMNAIQILKQVGVQQR